MEMIQWWTDTRGTTRTNGKLIPEMSDANTRTYHQRILEEISEW